MKRPLSLLAFDFGASGGRAVRGRFDGARLELEEVHRFPNRPVTVAGTMHWDVLRLFEELKAGIAAGLKAASGRLASLGVDTWGVDFGLLDRQGRLLQNPVAYRDPRTDGILEQAFARVPRREIFETTGIQFLQFNTLFQLFALKQARSPVLEAADRLLLMPDLFNYFLTGEMKSEFTNATTTQAYDPRGRAWAFPLLEKLGLPTRLFTEIVPPATLVGKLLPEVAEEINAPRLPVIAPATHDTGSAVAAVPADGKQAWAYLSSGTWSLLGAEVKEPVLNDQVLELNFTNEGGVGDSFRLLKNIAGLWLIQECQRVWSREDGKPLSFEQINRLARQAKPGASRVDPDSPDFLRPQSMPRAIQEYCRKTGQKVPKDRGAIVRCALASLADKYRQVLGMLEQLQGRRVEVLHVVGGGARNKLLCQRTADACGVPVLAGPEEATAVGNLCVQLMALGKLGSLEEARELIRASFPIKLYQPRGTGDGNL